MLKSLNSMVSHDMRGPLNSINQMAKILLTSVSDPRSRDLMYAIRNASMILHIQVNDLLDNSLLDKGLFTAKLEVFNVKTVVEEVISVMSHQAELNQIKI